MLWITNKPSVVRIARGHYNNFITADLLRHAPVLGLVHFFFSSVVSSYRKTGPGLVTPLVCSPSDRSITDWHNQRR